MTDPNDAKPETPAAPPEMTPAELAKALARERAESSKTRKEAGNYRTKLRAWEGAAKEIGVGDPEGLRAFRKISMEEGSTGLRPDEPTAIGSDDPGSAPVELPGSSSETGNPFELKAKIWQLVAPIAAPGQHDALANGLESVAQIRDGQLMIPRLNASGDPVELVPLTPEIVRNGVPGKYIRAEGAAGSGSKAPKPFTPQPPKESHWSRASKDQAYYDAHRDEIFFEERAERKSR